MITRSITPFSFHMSQRSDQDRCSSGADISRFRLGERRTPLGAALSICLDRQRLLNRERLLRSQVKLARSAVVAQQLDQFATALYRARVVHESACEVCQRVERQPV